MLFVPPRDPALATWLARDADLPAGTATGTTPGIAGWEGTAALTGSRVDALGFLAFFLPCVGCILLEAMSAILLWSSFCRS